MPEVILEKYDPSKFSSTFSVGEHVIGRGANLYCNSKRVSRNHGILRVTENGEVFLRSTHNNPCFYQRSASTSIGLVTFGKTVEIRNNDMIALSLDHGFFKVQIRDVTNASDSTKRAGSPAANQDTLANKRAHDESNETGGKRTKVSNCEPSTQAGGDDCDNVIPEADVKKEPAEDSLAKASGSGLTNTSKVTIKTESVGEDEVSSNKSIKEGEELANNGAHTSTDAVDKATDNASTADDDGDSEDVKKDDDDGCCKKTESKASPSTSGTNKRAWRDKCWYGAACYRKNAAHHVELRHPGDSDYDSDPNDSRPACCYGVDCYRKSKEHRRRLKHPGQKKPGVKPKVTRKRRTVKVNAPSPHPSDSDEPYHDSGSDEYMPSEGSDTESDYEDDEDYSQNDDRLLLQREARKFTSKK